VIPPGRHRDHAASQLRLYREAHINRLGNLTPVTQPLNSSLPNASLLSLSTSLDSKRDGLAKRTVLLINQHLGRPEDWNEQLIDDRSTGVACVLGAVRV